MSLLSPLRPILRNGNPLLKLLGNAFTGERILQRPTPRHLWATDRPRMCYPTYPFPLLQGTDEDSIMREFCTLASESRVQTGPLDTSNIYYALPEHFRPGQQDVCDLFQHFMDIVGPLFQSFFTGIETQTQHYSQCRPCNTQSLPFTTRVLHVNDTTHTTGLVSLEQLILDSNAPETCTFFGASVTTVCLFFFVIGRVLTRLD